MKTTKEALDYLFEEYQKYAPTKMVEGMECFSKEGSDWFDSIIIVRRTLEAYQKIEKQLGIDLSTLVKALTEKVYIYHNGKVTKCEQAPLLLCFDGDYCLEYHFDDDIEQVYLKDKDKTWAFKKEKLL